MGLSDLDHLEIRPVLLDLLVQDILLDPSVRVGQQNLSIRMKDLVDLLILIVLGFQGNQVLLYDLVYHPILVYRLNHDLLFDRVDQVVQQNRLFPGNVELYRRNFRLTHYTYSGSRCTR